MLSHVANIKLIWRCLNTARGKFVRGFANLVKFKYYVLITHKVLRPRHRPRTSALASIKFVAVPATKSLSANAVKDDATNVDRIENLYKSLFYYVTASSVIRCNKHVIFYSISIRKSLRYFP